ncbi:MAG: MBL fold metallo-hydrolase [Gemmatimonadota bacterium]
MIVRRGWVGPTGFLLLVSFGYAPIAAQQTEYETTKIADGVYQFRFRAHNAFFAVGETGAFVMDPISAEAAGHLAAAILDAAPGVPLQVVAYSHDHADHATGAPVLFQKLNRAPVVGHERAKEKIVARGDPALPPPDITVGDGEAYVAELGGRTVELRYLGKSHSDNMLVAFVPEQKVVFAVDFVSRNSVGYRDLPDYHYPDFLEAMRKLQEIEYETIVFGHGPPGDRSAVDAQLRYYTELRDAVAAAIRDGLSADEAMERVRLPRYAEWRGYSDWFPLNVGKMYRWLSEGGG